MFWTSSRKSELTFFSFSFWLVSYLSSNYVLLLKYRQLLTVNLNLLENENKIQPNPAL